MARSWSTRPLVGAHPMDKTMPPTSRRKPPGALSRSSVPSTGSESRVRAMAWLRLNVYSFWSLNGPSRAMSLVPGCGR